MCDVTTIISNVNTNQYVFLHVRRATIKNKYMTEERE
jgi:hypothetical protein